MKKHIVFDISGHGFGHFAQTAAVINHLGQSHPDWQVTIRTMVDSRIVDSRVNVVHQNVKHSTDFGMIMTSALDVDKERSLSRYKSFHANLHTRIDQESRILEELKPDLLFSNVSYLSIASAKKVGIPSVAMCSLNWADIFKGYFDSQESNAIYQDMVDCYNQADVFLCPQPSMAMPAFDNVKSISPLASLGTNRRQELLDSFENKNIRHIVLVAPGGIPSPIPIETWPEYEDIVFITSWGETSPRTDIVDITQLRIPFVDVLKSVDAVVTKPGYGTVAEAMCNHVPMMYVRRKDWPEEPFLVSWSEQFGKVKEVERDVLYAGTVKPELDKLLELDWKKAPPTPNGDEQASNFIAQLVS